MSKWKDIQKEDIEIDGNDINICLEGDDFGNNYAVIKTTDVIDLLSLKFDEKMEWISVKDRLPEESGLYLTYGGIYYNEKTKSEFLKVVRFKNNFICDFNPCAYVTHWMPLPEPPK